MKQIPTRAYVFPIICLLITIYFIYHGIQGAHGYRRMNQLKEEIILAERVAADTRDEKTLLEIKVRSLSPESLDRDQLEESALRVLNVSTSDTRVIFQE